MSASYIYKGEGEDNDFPPKKSSIDFSFHELFIVLYKKF